MERLTWKFYRTLRPRVAILLFATRVMDGWIILRPLQLRAAGALGRAMRKGRVNR